MAYIKKYNIGGPTTKPTYGKVYINGVDVTKNNQDAIDAIMSAFNDRKYVQDYLKSGNDIHITQNLDGSISYSGIPLNPSLKRRKKQEESEYVTKTLLGVARNQNPREPGKNIGRLGEAIYLKFSFKNKGLENEVGTLSEGDNNFAAWYRLKEIADFANDKFDEIEGWETFGNNKEQVKEYIKHTFLDQNGNIKEELLNALQPGSNYNDFIKYKDIFASINIIGKRDELTDEEKEAVQKEADLQANREKLGDFGINSDSGIVIDEQIELPVFPRDSNILKIINKLGADKNYHLNLDFVKKYRNELGNDPILKEITDNFENSLFYINGHVYKAKSLMNPNGSVKLNPDDLAVFNQWVIDNKNRPDLSSLITSYYTTDNPYFVLDGSNYYPGLPLVRDGIYKIDNYYDVGDNDAILYRTNRGDMAYDQFGFPILEQGVFGSWSGNIDTNLFNEIFSKAKRLSTPQKWYYKKPLQFYKVSEGNNVKYYPVTLSETYGEENNPVYELIYPYSGHKYVLYSSGDKPSLSFANIDEKGNFDMKDILGGEIIDQLPVNATIARKSGGTIQKAKKGLEFTRFDPLSPDNPMNPLNKNNTGLENVQLTPQLKPEQQFSLKPKVDLVKDALSPSLERLMNMEAQLESTNTTDGNNKWGPVLSDEMNDKFRKQLLQWPKVWDVKDVVSSAMERWKEKRKRETKSGDIPGLEPLKPNWISPVLRSVQLISQLAGSKAAEKRMAKAIRESYTPKETVQYTTPKFDPASFYQFINANQKTLLDAQANTPLTSDPTKNMSYQQYWAQQRAAQIGKESALYSDIIDKHQAKNWEIENKNRELAITTNNENNKALATMRSALHQNAAQGILQSASIFGQFVAGMQSEAEKARLYEEGNWKSRQYDIATNSFLDQLRSITNQIDQGYEAFKEKNPTTTLTKEEWLSQNPDLKAKRDDLSHYYRDMLSRIQTMTYDPYSGNYHMPVPFHRYYVPQTQFGEDYVDNRKKGGKLSFIEKISLEDKKSSNKKELERTKAMIKSMEKSNERLFKLILKILE